MKKLPIGIQSFEKIRTGNFYYVDKTFFVKKLVEEGDYFFLSRPRRFGKSLFLDTLRQAFLGKKELFNGLYLENNWNWNKIYPVIYISFGSGVIRSKEELTTTIEEILWSHEKNYNISLKLKSIKGKFMELISSLFEKFNEKVVILIDEYDKPILDNITNIKTAIEIREELKNFYSVIKDCDQFLKFVFITGVTKFSKVSLFSGLNNLKDITLSPSYATICGYTQKELEEVFKDRLKKVNLKEIKEWYDGYSFLGEKVYNPFDVLLYLDEGIYRAYWFETGSPTFLLKLIKEKGYFIPELEDLEVSEKIVSSFDIEKLEIETLLFQTGYLTIKGIKRRIGRNVYKLGYPNLEVKVSLNDYILDEYSGGSISEKEKRLNKIYDKIENNDIEGLIEEFKRVFSGLPYHWYSKNNIYIYEGFYSSIFYSYFCALGVEVIGEDVTSRGRIDLTVKLNDKIYIFEFKVIRTDKEFGFALKQLKAKKYHEKYKDEKKKIFLIGIEFSEEEKNIVNYEWEKVY